MQFRVCDFASCDLFSPKASKIDAMPLVQEVVAPKGVKVILMIESNWMVLRLKAV